MSTDLATAEEKVRKAEENLAKAREKADAEKAEARKAQQARVAEAWQATLDTYDPAALRADVVAKASALEEAAAESGLSRALVDYLAAMMREARRGSEARDALANGATWQGDPRHYRGGTLRAVDGMTTASGQRIGYAEQAVLPILAKAIANAAHNLVDAELEERRAQRTAHVGDGIDRPKTPLELYEDRAQRKRQELAAQPPGSIRPEDMTPEQYARWHEDSSARTREQRQRGQ